METYCGDCYLGIDAGSTTTKMALIGQEGQLLYSFYANNKGNPIETAKTAIWNLKTILPGSARIARTCSTGYGESLLKSAFNLDEGEVETIAHCTAASFFDKNVDCVLDIGGQDMKCIRLKNGTVDSVMMRVIEVITSFPSLLITLLIMMVVGQNVGGLLFAMCITSWCGTARQMRGQLMQLRESEYVQAAQMIGASPVRIIIKHLLPNTVSILILNLCSSIPSYIFTEASLSFLGMGLSSDVISLGVLISQGKAKMDFYPWQLFFPAAVLCIAVLAFNLLGDGLRDALDPRTIE